MEKNIKQTVISLIDDYNRTNYRLDLIERDVNVLKQSLVKISSILNDSEIMNSAEILNANINDVERKITVLENEKTETVEILEKLRDKEYKLMVILRSDPNHNETEFQESILVMLNEQKK